MDPAEITRRTRRRPGEFRSPLMYWPSTSFATPAPGPAAVFTWLPTVPASGAYKIYANWPADASRPTDAVFNVIHAGGTTPVVVNQRQNGGQWHLLGTYTLDPGQNHGVDLESSTTGVVAADAIRIVADSAAPQNVAYVHADHLATPQKMTDPSGTVVWDRDALPFGQTASLTGTGELPLRFPGQYYDDETGLYYNYFRDYDPTTGRYIQSDPIGLEGGLNTYAYVDGNPIVKIDPFGLYGTSSCNYYGQTCQANSGRYECSVAKRVCPIFPDDNERSRGKNSSDTRGNWSECVRQCLQEKHMGRMSEPLSCSSNNTISNPDNANDHTSCFAGCRRHPENPYDPAGPDLPSRDLKLFE